MVRILVTGAAGFIGSAYVRHVLAEHPEDDVLGSACPRRVAFSRAVAAALVEAHRVPLEDRWTERRGRRGALGEAPRVQVRTVCEVEPRRHRRSRRAAHTAEPNSITSAAAV